MDAQNRNARADLSDLEEAIDAWGTSGDFFALVRVLRQRIGNRAALRFRAEPSLACPSADLSAIHLESERATLTQTFLNTAGITGRLPSFMLEEILHEDPDYAPRRDLLDIFHHRAVDLLVDAIVSNSPARSIRRDHKDRWSSRLSAIAGAPESALTPTELIRILPLVATSRRSATGFLSALRCLLTDRYDIAPESIGVRELQGTRVEVALPARSRLGVRGHALGQDAVLGTTAFDPTAACCVHIDELDEAWRSAFERGGDAHRVITELFRMFDPDSTELTIELRFRGPRAGAVLSLCRLARDSWLSSRDARRSLQLRSNAPERASSTFQAT